MNSAATRREYGLRPDQCMAPPCENSAEDGNAGGALCPACDALYSSGDIHPCAGCGLYDTVMMISAQSDSYCGPCRSAYYEAE